MINITRLWTGLAQPADDLRYGTFPQAPANAAGRKPVVVWNLTRTCNLNCIHCYINATPKKNSGELAGEEAFRVIRDLADYGIKHLLLSGGEPTLHPDFTKIGVLARSLGIQLTLSTNGTRITPGLAMWLKNTGFAYVGISLDGIGSTHDFFRGRTGAFSQALQGIRNCRHAGQKTGLRLTLSHQNIRELDGIFRLIENEGIDRVCFYHLVPSGRGGEIEMPKAEETRQALDAIIAQASQWATRGANREVLTVTQPADGAYLLHRLEIESSPRFKEVLRLLAWNGGAAHGSGSGIANIDPLGQVHPDQFSAATVLGNVKNRPFGEIWEDHRKQNQQRSPTLRQRLRGRCRRCRYLGVCGGGFRARASYLTGDPAASDPGCYLNDAVISGSPVIQKLTE